MALRISKVSGDNYVAEVTSPHSVEYWKTQVPIGLRDLIDELERIGCHQRDIGDALYEIDPDWPSHLKKSV